MVPTVYYCYDAYCGWCYGFSPVIRGIAEEFKDKVAFEALSGGMIPRESAQPIARIAGFLKDAYPVVENTTGVRFGQDFLWHIENPELSDWLPHSEKAAVAMTILKEHAPHRSIEFAADLQKALYLEGRDLTDDEAYRHLLEPYGMTVESFYSRLRAESFISKAHHEFSLVRQLRVTGFPAVLMQTGELRFVLLAKGFVDSETLRNRLNQALFGHDQHGSKGTH
jgi:putative protein-disulfide isomerase